MPIFAHHDANTLRWVQYFKTLFVFRWFTFWDARAKIFFMAVCRTPRYCAGFRWAIVALHYNAVIMGARILRIMGAMASQITRGIYRWPVNSPHKGPVRRKIFPFDYVIVWHSLLYASGNVPWCITEDSVIVVVNTLRPIQNGNHFADDILKCISLNKNVWISIKKKFVPN